MRPGENASVFSQKSHFDGWGFGPLSAVRLGNENGRQIALLISQ